MRVVQKVPSLSRLELQTNEHLTQADPYIRPASVPQDKTATRLSTLAHVLARANPSLTAAADAYQKQKETHDAQVLKTYYRKYYRQGMSDQTFYKTLETEEGMTHFSTAFKNALAAEKLQNIYQDATTIISSEIKSGKIGETSLDDLAPEDLNDALAGRLADLTAERTQGQADPALLGLLGAQAQDQLYSQASGAKINRDAQALRYDIITNLYSSLTTTLQEAESRGEEAPHISAALADLKTRARAFGLSESETADLGKTAILDQLQNLDQDDISHLDDAAEALDLYKNPTTATQIRSALQKWHDQKDHQHQQQQAQAKREKLQTIETWIKDQAQARGGFDKIDIKSALLRPEWRNDPDAQQALLGYGHLQKSIKTYRQTPITRFIGGRTVAKDGIPRDTSGAPLGYSKIPKAIADSGIIGALTDAMAGGDDAWRTFCFGVPGVPDSAKFTQAQQDAFLKWAGSQASVLKDIAFSDLKDALSLFHNDPSWWMHLPFLDLLPTSDSQGGVKDPFSPDSWPGLADLLEGAGLIRPEQAGQPGKESGEYPLGTVGAEGLAALGDKALDPAFAQGLIQTLVNHAGPTNPRGVEQTLYDLKHPDIFTPSYESIYNHYLQGTITPKIQEKTRTFVAQDSDLRDKLETQAYEDYNSALITPRDLIKRVSLNDLTVPEIKYALDIVVSKGHAADAGDYQRLKASIFHNLLQIPDERRNDLAQAAQALNPEKGIRAYTLLQDLAPKPPKGATQ